MTPPEQHQVALELERLRGTMAEGFAALGGRLDNALQRTSQTEADIDKLEQRIELLERARWPLPSVAALVALVGLGLSLYQLAAR
ncbi:hypothetical protein SCWH03_28760 [Streptomyces pacificus]|uniref:Uncharacterized protein n=1 Tax=Streptomyces pacificus TaxID=2705029 RepID=A0A6A0AW50_9ACTN|nr:hypothetical protein SCWH03_28760 [Streptomyces pacificus]